MLRISLLSILMMPLLTAQTPDGGGGAASSVAAGVNPQQQQKTEELKPEDKCTVEGTVVNAVTGEPLKKANLTLQREDANRPESPFGGTSDATGHFVIKNVTPGKYGFSASRNGYSMSAYGAKGKSAWRGTPLTLMRGQHMKDVVFKLRPQGVISGRVIDEDNEPIPSANVSCMQTEYLNGKKMATMTGNAGTNDRGEFRMFGLRPGRCYVQVSVRNQSWGMPEIRSDDAPNEGYAPTYYPGTPLMSAATPIDVTPGAEITNIDVKMKRTHTISVSGRVVGGPVSRIQQVVLMPRDQGYGGYNSMRGGVTDMQGRFAFRDVIPGAYRLSAMSSQSDSNEQLQGMIDVDAAENNIENIQLLLAPPAVVIGAISVEGRPDISELKKSPVSVGATQADGNMSFNGTPYGEMKEDGTFKLRVNSPDRYRLSVSGLPHGYYIKSIRVGPTETSDEVVDFTKSISGEIGIVVSPSGGTIDGVVAGEDKKPVAGAVVIVIPPDNPRDNTSVVRQDSTDQYGKFSLKGIKPGNYKLFAFDDLEWGAYRDPEFMKPFEEKGESIEVKENDKLSKDLKLIVTDESAPGAPKSAEK